MLPIETLLEGALGGIHSLPTFINLDTQAEAEIM